MLIQSNSPVPPELARHEASKFKPGEAHISKFGFLCALLDIKFLERRKVDNLLPNIDMQVASQIDQLVEMIWCMHSKDVAFCILLCTSIHINE